jgi:hypothetical protein
MRPDWALRLFLFMDGRFARVRGSPTAQLSSTFGRASAVPAPYLQGPPTATNHTYFRNGATVSLR